MDCVSFPGSCFDPISETFEEAPEWLRENWIAFENQSPDEACVAWGEALHDATLIAATGIPEVGPTRGFVVLGGMEARAVVFRAPASTFRRTETLSGRAASRRVAQIEQSMRSRGYVGEAVKAIEINGQRYVLDGHHRLEAARRVGIEVEYQLVDEALLPSFGYNSADEVLQASANATPNRLR